LKNLFFSNAVSIIIMTFFIVCTEGGSSCGSSATTSSTDSSDSDDRCDSSLGLEDDKDFPVEILPYLYLGNAANSEDSDSLSRHGIQVQKTTEGNLICLSGLYMGAWETLVPMGIRNLLNFD